MTKQYYECHVIMEGDPKVIRPIVEDYSWKFSCIDDDPDLGEGIKCYATHQFNARMGVDTVRDVLRNVSHYFKREGIKVLRNKVELVVYDERVV